jgi:hypothetical protein
MKKEKKKEVTPEGSSSDWFSVFFFFFFFWSLSKVRVHTNLQRALPPYVFSSLQNV